MEAAGEDDGRPGQREPGRGPGTPRARREVPAGRARRTRLGPPASRWPVPVAAGLGAAATVEAVLRALAVDETTDRRPLLVAVFVLLGLAATVPVALTANRPGPAAALVAGALVVSVLATETMVFAGVAAQLITGYRLGFRARSPGAGLRYGPSSGGARPSSRPRFARAAALLLAAPFPLLALVALSGSVAVSQTEPADGPPTATTESSIEVSGFVVPLALLAVAAPVAALAGIAHRAGREAAAGRAATEAIADTLLEHTARGERARIARELHDVVAHHISMVAVQTETARLTTPGMPEAGAQRLRAIGDTARAALTEMRRLLGVLREDTGDEPAALAPQPGLRLPELNALIDSDREAGGGSARLVLTGRPRVLDPGIELAAYRVIQEALTNARRHAPGASVDVALAYTREELELTIRDNGPGPSPAPPGTGHGLTGMRERAAAVGGHLTVGADPAGGFLVRLRLPLPAESAP